MGILGDNNEKEPKTGFFSNLIKKIKYWFIGENESNSSPNSRTMTRENLEDLVVNVFKNRMEQLTTRRSLLFHAKLEIYMHKNDYDNLQGSFGPTATDLSEIFHEIICDKCIEIKEKNKSFKYTPHTSSWYFQFLPFHENDIDNGVEIVPQGTILAKTEVYTPARGNKKTHNININVIETQKVSDIPIVTHQNKNQSVVIDVSFDENNYKNLIVLDRNTFEVPFKEVIIDDEGENITTPPPTKGNNPLAQLKWSDAKGVKQANITQKDIKIAGSIDKVMDGGIPVLPLNNDNIQSPHVHIRYDESTGEFKIMAFAETKLNSRSLPIKEWCNLPKKNTKILMGSGFNVVQIEFEGLV